MGLPRPYSPPTVDVPHIGGVLVRKMGREASVNRRKNRKGPFQIMESIDSGRPWSGRSRSIGVVRALRREKRRCESLESGSRGQPNSFFGAGTEKRGHN